MKQRHALFVLFCLTCILPSTVFGAAISGTVTSDGITGIANVTVKVYDINVILKDSVRTAADGTYTGEVDLPAGNYKVWFDASGTTYASEWYNDKPNLGIADVVPDGTTGVDAVLAPGGRISGRVTNGTTGILNIVVTAYDSGGNFMGSGVTAGAGGTYTVGGLPTGSYKVWFDASTTGYVSEWYDNKGFATADSVDVTASNETTLNDAVLAVGGRISGRVTNGTTGIPNLRVSVYDATPSLNLMGRAFTAANGTYTVGGLPAGNYKVYFDASGTGYHDEWYDNRRDPDSADTVPVTAGMITQGVSAVLDLLLTVTKAGTGSGSVVSWPGGINCGSACSAYYPTNRTVALSATPDIGGSLFSGWSGDADCTDGVVTMPSDISCTATFETCLGQPARIGSTGYNSIDLAYTAAAASGDTIEVIAANQEETLDFDQGKVLTLRGGHDCTFAPVPGAYTTITGSLTVSSGTVTVDRIVIYDKVTNP